MARTDYNIDYFIDGSALIAQIRKLQKEKREFAGKKLDISFFSERLSRDFAHYFQGYARRITYYFLTWVMMHNKEKNSINV